MTLKIMTIFSIVAVATLMFCSTLNVTFAAQPNNVGGSYQDAINNALQQAIKPSSQQTTNEAPPQSRQNIEESITDLVPVASDSDGNDSEKVEVEGINLEDAINYMKTKKVYVSSIDKDCPIPKKFLKVFERDLKSYEGQKALQQLVTKRGFTLEQAIDEMIDDDQIANFLDGKAKAGKLTEDGIVIDDDEPYSGNKSKSWFEDLLWDYKAPLATLAAEEGLAKVIYKKTILEASKDFLMGDPLKLYTDADQIKKIANLKEGAHATQELLEKLVSDGSKKLLRKPNSEAAVKEFVNKEMQNLGIKAQSWADDVFTMVKDTVRNNQGYNGPLRKATNVIRNIFSEPVKTAVTETIEKQGAEKVGETVLKEGAKQGAKRLGLGAIGAGLATVATFGSFVYLNYKDGKEWYDNMETAKAEAIQDTYQRAIESGTDQEQATAQAERAGNTVAHEAICNRLGVSAQYGDTDSFYEQVKEKSFSGDLPD